MNKRTLPIYIFFLYILILNSPYSYANCIDNNTPGKKITFIRTNVENELASTTWVSDRFTPSPVDINTIYGKSAILQQDSYFRRPEKSIENKNKYEYFRYYKTTLENCDVIWGRFRENDQKLNNLWIKNRKIDDYVEDNSIDPNDNIDFERASDYLNFVQESAINMIKKYIGKEIYIVPTEINHDKVKEITSKNLEKSNERINQIFSKDEHYYLNGISIKPLSITKSFSSILNIEITSKPTGNKIYIPWSDRKIVLDKNMIKNIRSEYKNDIHYKKIRYGMNKYEILKSWGQPLKIRFYNDNSKIQTKTKKIVDEEIIDKRFSKISINNSDIQNQEQLNEIWFYKKDALQNGAIVLNYDGILKKELQLSQDESKLSFAEESFNR